MTEDAGQSGQTLTGGDGPPPRCRCSRVLVFVGLCLVVATVALGVARHVRHVQYLRTPAGRAERVLDELRGPSLRDRLIGGYATPGRFVPTAVKDRLVRIGPGAVPTLVEALKEEGYLVFCGAAEALGEIGPVTDEVLPALVAALRRGGDRGHAAKYALARMGPAAKDAVPSLIQMLKSGNPDARHSAGWVLGAIGPVTDDVVPALIKALSTDPSPDVRQNSAGALGHIGTDAKGVASALIEALTDPSAYVRSSTARALGRIGQVPDAVVPALVKASEDEDRNVRRVASKALENIRKARQPSEDSAVQPTRDLPR